MLIVIAVIAATAALASWMVERVDAPKRRAEREANARRLQPAE